MSNVIAKIKRKRARKMGTKEPSWMRSRTTEELGDFIARLVEKRTPALETISLED
jgi:hypothetical protein